MILVELSLIFAKVAALTFGGGYAMVPLFEDEIVFRHAFMSGAEFANLVGLAQITPGPIGLNSATYVGMARAGLAGALAATLGAMAPSFVFSTAAVVFLRKAAGAEWLKALMKGVRPCVVGIIGAAAVFFANTSVFTAPVSEALAGVAEFGVRWQGAAIFVFALVFRRALPKVNPAWVLLASGALGGLLPGG